MTYYEILGLTNNAGILEIKSAYRRLAMLYHPDRNTGNEDSFKIINEAYKVLSDVDKKQEYDSKNNVYMAKNIETNSQYKITAPYDSTLNVFNESLKEVFEIIKSGNPRALKQSITLLKNVSLENHYYQKYTPLMEAVYMQRLDMVKMITKEIKDKYTRNNVVQSKYKSYLNQINVEGKTALIIGSLSLTDPEIMKFLINEGAEIRIIDNQGKTIFDYAPLSQSDDVEDYINELKKIYK